MTPQLPARDREKNREKRLQKMEDLYVQNTWRFQQSLVRILHLPAPFALAYLLYWHMANLPGYPPLIVFVILLGSIGLSLAAAFFFWRCPACNQILFRTSGSGAAILFWLADPDSCPDCGASLRPLPKRPPSDKKN